MATPLKLKRKSPHLESTFDRTFHAASAFALKDAIPAFQPSTRQVASRANQVKQEPRQFSPLSVFEDTTELEERVYRYILEDSQKSEFSKRYGYRNRAYSDYPSKMKFIKGNNWSIPQRVRDLYTLQQAQNHQSPSFVHGCLSSTAIYYFAIQKRVVFYDLGRAVFLNIPLQECFMQEHLMEDRVFQIREITWASTFFNQFMKKNIVLVASPWKIEFMVLEVPETTPKDANVLLRKAKMTMLNYHFVLNTPKAEFITQGDRQIFYIDSKGKVNRLWFEQKKLWQRIFSSNDNFKQSVHSKQNSLSRNYFYVHRKASLLDRIKQYQKVLFTQVKTFFTKSIYSYGLAYDRKRKLLFSLVDTHCDQKNSQSKVEYSYSKLLTCWEVVQGKLVMRCEVSQLQLLTCPQNQQLLTHNIGKNNKISKILPVEQAYYPDSCILLILQSGIRFYLSLENSSFKIASYQLPPSYERSGLTRKCVEYNKAVQLIHYDSVGGNNFMTVRENNENHSFFIWKDSSNKDEEQSCSYINWGNSIVDGIGGEPPAQSFIFKSKLGYTSNKKTQLLKNLSSKSFKNPLCDSANAHAMHPLARDIFLQVPLYIHVTNLYLQYFYIARPIDLTFMAISAQVFDKKLIQNIFTSLSVKDIQCLLLQLLCDSDGIYLRDFQMTQCFKTYVKVCLKNGLYKDFDSHRVDFYKGVATLNTQRRDEKLLKVQLVEGSTISSLTYQKTCDLILSLCLEDPSSRSKSSYNLDANQKGAKYLTQINQIYQTTLTYISRILRYIWNQDLSQINTKIIHLVTMIEPVLKVIDQIFDHEYFAKARLEFQHQRYTVFDKIKKIGEKQGKQERREEVFARHQESIKKLKYFINKVIQLLLLSSQVNLKVKRTFSACLGMRPQFLQQSLFNYLIVNYTQPFKTLQIYRKTFPLFIGKNLERSLKIYNQTKFFNSKDTYEVAKHHSDLPDYLLAYFKSEKKIQSWQLKQLREKQSIKTKIKQTGRNYSSKESIQEMIRQMDQERVHYIERTRLIDIIENQLNLYQDANKYVQDSFYRKNKRYVAQVSRVVNFQVLLLEEYRKKQSQDQWVTDHLANNLLKFQGLKSIVDVIESYAIKIIFFYFFQKESNSGSELSINNMFQAMFVQEFKIYKQSDSESGFSLKNIVRMQKPKKSWTHLHDQLFFIISKIKNDIVVEPFMDILCQSLQCARRLVSDQNLQFPAIDSLKEFIMTQDKHQRKVQLWTLENPYPVISLALINAGMTPKALEEFYIKKLHELAYKKQLTPQALLPMMPHYFLNLFCLLLVHKSVEGVQTFVDKIRYLISRIRRYNLMEVVDIDQFLSLTEIIQITIGHRNSANFF